MAKIQQIYNKNTTKMAKKPNKRCILFGFLSNVFRGKIKIDMRYVEVIDLQGNKQIIDCYKRRFEDRYIVEGHRFGFDADFVFVINNEKFGLLREFNCKDDSLEEKQIWFFNYLELDADWNKLYEYILNNEKLLQLLAQEYRGKDSYY